VTRAASPGKLALYAGGRYNNLPVEIRGAGSWTGF